MAQVQYASSPTKTRTGPTAFDVSVELDASEFLVGTNGYKGKATDVGTALEFRRNPRPGV
jgi:hypothetical protein